MPDGTISPGHIVTSAAGRDAGHSYVVLGWSKSQTLLVADGRGRKVMSPKKKNSKHVMRHSIADNVAAALASGKKVTDEEVRQALANFGGAQIRC